LHILPLTGKFELASSLLCQEIVIEKVGIKECLQDATKVHDPVMLVSLLRMSAVDPIQDIQKAVGTHEKNVVPGQILYFSVTLQDN